MSWSSLVVARSGMTLCKSKLSVRVCICVCMCFVCVFWPVKWKQRRLYIIYKVTQVPTVLQASSEPDCCHLTQHACNRHELSVWMFSCVYLILCLHAIFSAFSQLSVFAFKVESPYIKIQQCSFTDVLNSTILTKCSLLSCPCTCLALYGSCFHTIFRLQLTITCKNARKRNLRNIGSQLPC